MGLSIRDLASRMGVSHSSLHTWLTGKNGYPSTKAFKREHLLDLSKAIKLPLLEIQVALDESRRIYTDQDSPMPQTQVDSLGSLIEWLEHDPRKYLLRVTVLNFVKRLYAGSGVPKRQS